MKVSNLVRSVISNQEDRVYVGFQSRCRIYDDFPILRCFNCQVIGHHSAMCGYCGRIHRTDKCVSKSDPLIATVK